MGQGFTVVVAFLFFVFYFFAFVLHVTFPACLFVVQLIHASAGAVCFSSLMGQQLFYFIDHGQALNKDNWQHLKCGPV